MRDELQNVDVAQKIGELFQVSLRNISHMKSYLDMKGCERYDEVNITSCAIYVNRIYININIP